MKKKAKKLPKYQTGSPCGAGTIWDEDSQQCVPDTSGETSIIQDGLITDPNIGTKNLHFKDNKGTQIPYANADTEAITKGFNYDSDGVYRKNVITEDPNKQQFSGFFQLLNMAQDATQFIANSVTDAKTQQDEQQRLNKARYQQSRYNVHESGHNDVPVYLGKGGKIGKYICQVGGKPTYTNNPKDPRLQAYNDSLILYNATKNDPAKLKNATNFTDWWNYTSQWHHDNKNAIDAFEHLKNLNGIYPQGKTTTKTFTDDMIGDAVVYKKPVGIPTPQRPKGKLENINLLAYNMSDSGRPIPHNMEMAQANYDTNKPTKYSFTSPTGVGQNGQKTQYFPTQAALDEFLKGVRGASSQAGEDYKTATGYLQNGGLINTTGYLKDANTRTNPINIIPGGNITTEEMAFPITANGVPLYPNTGDYKFNSKYVVEKPMQQGGGVFKTQSEIDAANAFARGISVRKGLVAGENAYVANKIGDRKPTMILPPNQVGVTQKPLAYTVPSYVQRSDIQTANGSAWYNDPQNGNSVLIDMSVLNQPRFKKTDDEITNDLATRKLKTGGGIHINPKNKGKLTATKKATGKTTEELTHSKNPITKKRAIFAQNAAKWHHYQDGGDVPEVNDSATNPNAMLERGEVFQQQNGQIQKVSEDADTHEAQSGGSPQANVDRVLEDTGDKRNDKESKLLLVKPTEVKAMFDFKPKRSVTHSKLYEKVLEKDAKDIKGIERKIKQNLEYAQNNGGIYAQNSLDENLKLLTEFPTKQERFDTVFAHQESIKQANNIDQEDNTSKWGGKMKKYQTGGQNYRKVRQDKYTGKLPPYPATWQDYYDVNQKKQYTAPDWITPEQFYNTPGVVDYMNTLDQVGGVDNDLHKADDTEWGYRHQAALDKFFPNGKPQEQQFQQVVNNSKLTLPKSAQASTVNEGLGWSAGYGNLLGLIDSFGRTPVPLEQLDAGQMRVHEEDVRPVINANLSDYNSAVAQLPQNGVGYANMANLQAQKYRADNQAVAAVESRNKQKYDQVDAANGQAQFQVDQANLQLRDQFNNRVLIGKEKQRQQKFEYINGLFKAIDERNAFNRNANLALQITPYFDQFGKFNNQKYQVASKYNSPDGQRVEYIEDRQSGQQFRVIYDRDGKLISSTKVVGDSKATGNYKVSLK